MGSILLGSLLGNLDDITIDNIVEDNDYHAKVQDIFTLSKVSANDIEVITVTGSRIPSPRYKPFIIDSYEHTYNTWQPPRFWTIIEDPVNAARDAGCDSLRGDEPENCDPDIARASLRPNGCSDRGLGFGWSSYFRASCNDHDICYGRTSSTQKECDVRFHRLMELQCLNKPPASTTRDLCYHNARYYYRGVRVGGAGPFKDAQIDRACVDWDDEVKYYGCKW